MTYKTVDWKALLGHRVLFSFGGCPRVYEARVLEVSPDNAYMRVRYWQVDGATGAVEWIPTASMWSIQDLTNNPYVDYQGDLRNDQHT